MISHPDLLQKTESRSKPSPPNTNAGPTLATPAAQCAGVHRFRYAAMPFSGDWIDAGVAAVCRRWRTLAPSIQGVHAGHTPGGLELVRVDGAALRVTAIKRHEERDTLILRLHNLTGEQASGTITFGLSLRGAWRTDLLEDRGEALAVDGHEVRLEVGPHRIQTLEAEFET